MFNWIIKEKIYFYIVFILFITNLGDGIIIF